MAGFTVNGTTFKSKKAYFYVMNPDVKNETKMILSVTYITIYLNITIKKEVIIVKNIAH